MNESRALYLQITIYLSPRHTCKVKIAQPKTWPCFLSLHPSGSASGGSGCNFHDTASATGTKYLPFRDAAILLMIRVALGSGKSSVLMDGAIATSMSTGTTGSSS